jgi:hypothetical protein
VGEGGAGKSSGVVESFWQRMCCLAMMRDPRMASKRESRLTEFQVRGEIPMVVAIRSLVGSPDPSEPTTKGSVVPRWEYFCTFLA